MPVVYQPSQRRFYLQTGGSTYIMQIYDDGHLVHQYWGPTVGLMPEDADALLPSPADRHPGGTVDEQGARLEYPVFGAGDYRAPAGMCHTANGTAAGRLQYVSHTITAGKPALEGLPAVYAETDAEAQTLVIRLEDPDVGTAVELLYTVMEGLDAVIRSARIQNIGKRTLELERAMSASVDFDRCDFDMLQLSGAWARERTPYRNPLVPGIQSVDSKRGMSSHQHNPFFALMAKDAGEDMGEVYGFSLIYSGNFLAQAEVDENRMTRAQLGINPFGFRWMLEPGESFQTPETVMVYSGNGLGGMSRTYHRLYRTRLCRGRFRDTRRPVLINNWEATYFRFDEEKIAALASEAAPLGIQLLVLDDGWFGKRDDDHSSLGDWVEDRRKLPGGLKGLAERVRRTGMEFGLWVEPEMVSPDSNFYRAHPDWCLHVPEKEPEHTPFQRNQLVLDFSRRDVCDAVTERITAVLRSAPISYIKWDMNRSHTDVGSAALPPRQQGEVAHRFQLGLYRVMETITARFPDVLFEGCAGGGGRFDPAMLYYMPQIWTSDDTDAVERLKIQYGTSLVYPAGTMSAHVSAVPNHQVGRTTSIDFRGAVAMAGNFGYELDIQKLSGEDKEAIRRQIALYHRDEALVRQGDLYRLASPFEGEVSAWMFVSPDRSRALVTACRVLNHPGTPPNRLRLKGLEPGRMYRVTPDEPGETDRPVTAGGSGLMRVGLPVQWPGSDFQARRFRLESVPNASEP